MNSSGQLAAWDKKYAEQGLVVLQIYSEFYQDLATLQAYTAKRNIRYAVALDPKEGIHRKYFRERADYPKSTYPEQALLIGADGKVSWEGYAWGRDKTTFSRLIERELEKCRK